MDTRWRVTLFGGLRVVGAEREITRFPTRQTASLFAYLACHRQQPHSRDALIDLLWPGVDPDTGRHRLSQALSSLRRLLEPRGSGTRSVPARGPEVRADGLPPLFRADRASVQLEPGAVSTDLGDFTAALMAAGSASERGERARHLERAVALYAGELLAGLYDPWVLSEREWLAEQYFAALRDWLKYLAERGEFDRAIGEARRGVRLDPLREAAHHDLIRLLAAQGRPEAALQQYRALERRLKEELGAEPAPATRTLASQLGSPADPPGDLLLSFGSPQAPGVDREDAPTRSCVHNLPAALTRFFGRELELEQLHLLLLAEERRLVTLTGPGGSGKTCLALELARRLVAADRPSGAAPSSADDGPLSRSLDAIWLVPLAGLTDARQLPGRLREALRLAPNPESGPEEQVIAALSRHRALLVLDNFEHLAAEGAPFVRALLERVPRLRVLVTSRRRLNLPGERELPLPPLPIPPAAGVPGVACRVPGEGDAHAACTTRASRGVARHGSEPPIHAPPLRSVDRTTRRPAHLLAFPSVRLFLDRAQAVRPDFQLSPGNAATVAAICRQLEGLPLSIELAAARVQVLTPAEILTQLSHRFQLLVRREGGTDPRHHSLRAALESSFQLLTSARRRFFARLSLFRGSFTLEAAQRVAFAELPLSGSLDELEQLRECSLVLAEAHGEVTRYRLLETLREYGAEQLEAGDLQALARRHAAYYLELAEQGEIELRGPDQQVWLARLDLELDNLRAALEWSVGAGAPGSGRSEDAEIGLRLAGALCRFWELRGAWSEGRGWLARALALSGAADRTGWRARALHAAAMLARRQGDFTAARALAEESIAIWRSLGDRRNCALALVTLGFVFKDPGDLEAALPRFEESVALFRETEDPWGLALALDGLAQTLCVMGHDRGSRAPFAESLELMRRTGDRAMTARFLTHQGAVAHCKGNYRVSRAILDEILVLYQEVGDPLGIAGSLAALGGLFHAWDDDETAERNLRESLSIARKLGPCHTLAFVLDDMATLVRDQGDWATARALLEEGLKIWRQTGERARIAQWFLLLAKVAWVQGDPAQTRAGCKESLAIYRDLDDTWGMLEALGDLWRLACRQGDDAAARAVYEECRSLHGRLSHRRGIAWSFWQLGSMARHHGDLPAAERFCRESLVLRREAQDQGGIAACLQELAFVAAAREDPARAAWLLGAAAALHAAIDTPPRWREQPACNELRERLHGLLGEPAFATAWQAGHARTWEQAVTAALREGSPEE